MSASRYVRATDTLETYSLFTGGTDFSLTPGEGYLVDSPVFSCLRCCPPNRDRDGDGFGSGPFCPPAPDCDETDPTIFPGGDELCNLIDDNCNGIVDENDVESGGACSTNEPGLCGQSGILFCVDGAITCVRTAGGGPEVCANGIDDDCDGVVDEIDDSDGDGFDNCIDNCPSTYSLSLADSDGDGIGDACDDDSAAAPSEVTDLIFTSETEFTWSTLPGSQYNAYRGYSIAGLPASYNHQCLFGNSPLPSGVDPLVPFPANQFYYLVTAENSSGEGPFGVDSNAVPRPASIFGCPDPGQDRDADGVTDAVDNCQPDLCPPSYNPINGAINAQDDGDGDGVGDICDYCPNDVDPDFDGVCSLFDNCPNVANPGQADSDFDLIGDACDNCPTLDMTTTDQSDTDFDGVGDACDNCWSIRNANMSDQDGDCGMAPLPPYTSDPMCGDACDPCPTDSNPACVGCPIGDADGDGVCDDGDNCPTLNMTTTNQADTDGDCPPMLGVGINCGNACDPCTDTDGDGFGNPGFVAIAPCLGVDNCPNIPNPGQVDTDFDLIGDACDNCPLHPNALQTDWDKDGIGNVCDPVICGP